MLLISFFMFAVIFGIFNACNVVLSGQEYNQLHSNLNLVGIQTNQVAPVTIRNFGCYKIDTKNRMDL